jgi:aminopeptidase N
MVLRFNTRQDMTVVSNGKLSYGPIQVNPITSSWEWLVRSPINTYDVGFYIGNYVHWTDTMMGEKGILNLDFYALKHNEDKARKQFAVTKQMLHCFEYWMGPYPFYEDGYKLVEAPFLGMEHQSAIAYGNQYKMGYLGKDRSNTGVGLNFDFIIIHESGHEWYGNNITAKDIADNWIHEGFTTYTETLFAEYQQGKQKAYEYVQGQRLNIRNDIPIVGAYGVHKHGSGDMYDKAANLVHTVRVLMNDDERFRQMLRGMNEKFYHSFVTSADIETYMMEKSGLDLKAIFNQYLRTTEIPQLEYYIKNKELFYKFNKVVPGFSLPLELTNKGKKTVISPTSEWQSVKWKGGYDISFPKDFYFTIKS